MTYTAIELMICCAARALEDGRTVAVGTGLPCAAGFPIGHGTVNEPVPLGVRVRLDADAVSLTFLESATA